MGEKRTWSWCGRYPFLGSGVGVIGMVRLRSDLGRNAISEMNGCQYKVRTWVVLKCVRATVQTVQTIYSLWSWQARIISVSVVSWSKAVWHLNLSWWEGWFYLCLCVSLSQCAGSFFYKLLGKKRFQMSVICTHVDFEMVTVSFFCPLPSTLSLFVFQISCLGSVCCRLGDTSCLTSLGWKRCPRRTVMSSWHLQVRRLKTPTQMSQRLKFGFLKKATIKTFIYFKINDQVFPKEWPADFELYHFQIQLLNVIID